MIPQLLVLPLEAAFNTWLDPDAKTHGSGRERLRALQGKLIHIQLNQPRIDLYFMPTADKVHISTDYEAEPDVSIQGTALAFMRLADATDTGKALLENNIRIEGDVGVGTAFSEILRETDIDWEELLSQAIGDPAAHQIGQWARQTKSWLTESQQAMRQNTKDYLQEEMRVLPTEPEIRHYLDSIDSLRMDVDRLEARLRRLEGKDA